VAQAEADESRAAEPLLDFVPRITPRWLRPEHLAPVADVFERARRGKVDAVISVPPQHGKTELVLHAIAQHLALEPADTLAYVTYAAEQAYSKSRFARDYAQAAGVTLRVDGNAVHEWRTTAGGGLLATGIGGPLTGQGARVLIVDDPFKSRDDAESALMRDRALGWFTSTGTTRVPEHGSRIVIHTRWHPDDLIGRLRTGRHGDFEVIDLPFLTNAAGEPDEDGDRVLWARRGLANGAHVGWTPEGARARLRSVGPYDAWSLYLNRPRPKGGKVFGKDDVEPARYDVGPDGKPKLDGARIVLAVDAAGTASSTSDFTAAVALAVWGFGDEMCADVLDLLHVQGEPQQVAPLLYAFQTKWGGGSITIEASRDGKALAKALRGINAALRIHEVAAIGDKFTRAQPCAAAYNHGRVRLPLAAPWVFDLLAELADFTGLGDKHDDIVDALAHAWNFAAVPAPDRDLVEDYDYR